MCDVEEDVKLVRWLSHVGYEQKYQTERRYEYQKFDVQKYLFQKLVSRIFNRHSFPSQPSSASLSLLIFSLIGF